MNSGRAVMTAMLKEMQSTLLHAQDSLKSIRLDLDGLATKVATIKNALLSSPPPAPTPPPRRAIYLGDHEVLTDLHGGQRIYVDSRDVGIASHLMWFGQWEPWIEAQLMARVKPGMSVLDIGANFGYYTLNMAERVGARGAVHAFEANPAIARKLQKSVLVNGYGAWTTVHPIALSNDAGERQFLFSPQFSGGGCFSDATIAEFESITVRTARIDSLLPAGFEPEVVKMDVEGAEGLVISGGSRTFDSPRLRAVVTEFSPVLLAPHMEPLAFLQFFLSRGFTLALIEPSGNRIVQAEAFQDWSVDNNYLLFERMS